MHDPELHTAVAEILGLQALTRDEIVDALIKSGFGADPEALDDRVSDLADYDPEFSEVGGTRIFHVSTVLEGTRWTVFVDADDAAQGYVSMHPHLDAVGWWLLDDDIVLEDADGNELGVLEVEEGDAGGDVVFGPDGWLDGVAGGWATATVVDGRIRWAPCTEPPAATDAQATAVREGFELAVSPDLFGDVAESRPDLVYDVGDGTIHEAVLVDREAFVRDPVPPLPDLYAAAGLEQRGATIAAAGFDWGALESWRRHNRRKWRFGLDDAQADALGELLDAVAAVLDGGPEALGAADAARREQAARLAGHLDDGAIAEGFWAELEDDGLPERLGTFAAALGERLGEGWPSIGLTWLTARCLDLVGEHMTAATLLARTWNAEVTHRPALVDLAAFSADKGDAGLAFELLHQVGVEVPDADDEELDDAQLLLLEIAEFAAHRPRPSVGRNERCPCGSGRKYKACHLGREMHPLDDRAGWLYDKALRFLRLRAPEAAHELLHEAGDLADAPDAYWEFHGAQLFDDLVLHEQQLFDAFLAARDELLPDDEALLAAQWATVDRGVFEVERVGHGTLELYDIGRGERITVVNVGSDERTRPGVVMLGRPLPVGDTYRAFSGFVSIPRASADRFVDAIGEGDAIEIAALLAGAVRPPRLHNTDGEEMRFHTVRWRVPDPAAVGEALVAAGLRPGGEDGTWDLVRDSANQPDTIILHVRLEDDELVGEANSDRRAGELRELVAGALLDAIEIDAQVRTMDEIAAERDPDAPPTPDQDDPALREAVAAYIADYERRWLDMEVPALGGRTPRQAATDPVGREQLEQLLASFPVVDGDDPSAMSAERLRRALGL